MTPTEFAAAQDRVILQRSLHDDKRRTHLSSRPNPPALQVTNRWLYPLNILSRGGIELWDTVKGRGGTRPAYRVGQVDAELLDEELLELLRGQVQQGLKHFGSRIFDEWSSEIFLCLRAILFKLSIWDHNASYGAALQNLRYVDARRHGPVPTSPSRWQKACYGVCSVGGRYAWTKWKEWLTEAQGFYNETPHNIRLLSRLSSLMSNLHSTAAFVSFLAFLVNGEYRTLLDRILRLRLALASSQISRQVSFEYLNRQLVWHAFTEFLLFLLPIIGISRWRRWLSRAWRNVKLLLSKNRDEKESGRRGELVFLPERTCAICYYDQNPMTSSENEILALSSASSGVIGSAQTDITNPYETIPCRCVYCFVCLTTRLEAEDGEGWVCLRCGELVKESRPWTGDVLEGVPGPTEHDISLSSEGA